MNSSTLIWDASAGALYFCSQLGSWSAAFTGGLANAAAGAETCELMALTRYPPAPPTNKAAAIATTNRPTTDEEILVLWITAITPSSEQLHPQGWERADADRP